MSPQKRKWKFIITIQAQVIKGKIGDGNSLTYLYECIGWFIQVQGLLVWDGRLKEVHRGKNIELVNY